MTAFDVVTCGPDSRANVPAWKKAPGVRHRHGRYASREQAEIAARSIVPEAEIVKVADARPESVSSVPYTVDSLQSERWTFHPDGRAERLP